MDEAMTPSRLSRLRDLSRTAAFELRRVLGWPGLAGAVALAIAAALWCAVPAFRADTRSVHESVRLARAAKTSHLGSDVHADDQAHLLATLPELFPSFGQNGDDVATILAQARAANLTLGSAQYQIGGDRSGPFTTYQVLLPVKDRYVSIRRFVALVLDNVPNSALQEIHVERPAVNGDVLEARIRFDLIYRASRS
jgi:hypothetical protein